MERRLKAAALILALVLAAPAVAQLPADDRSEVLGPSYLPSDHNAGTLPSLSGFAGPSGESAFRENIGGRAFGNRVVAAVPVAKDVHIGLGLMSVSRFSSREPDFKRAPMKDVEGRRQRIAAVGLSLSF